MRSNTVSLRSVPKSPLVDEFDLTSSSGPKASERTMQLLRVYNLSHELGSDFRPVLKRLQAINDREPSADIAYAMSELAFLGQKIEAHDRRAKLDLYGELVLHACDYLFDPRFAARETLTIRTTAGPAICTTARWSLREGSSAQTRSSRPAPPRRSTPPRGPGT